MIYSYEHKGYILKQTEYNWHYSIYDAVTGEFICNAIYSKKLTEEEAKEQIEGMIELLKELGMKERG